MTTLFQPVAVSVPGVERKEKRLSEMVDEKDKDLAVKSQPSQLVISEEVVDNYMQTSQMLTSKFQQWLIKEVDFTTEIFGKGRKPTLLDPGAGKLIGFFQCRPRHRILERYYSKDEEGYESIRYAVAAEVVQSSTGLVVAEGVGSCSSDEVKYKYRWYYTSELRRMGYTDDDIEKLPEKMRGKSPVYRARNPEIPDLDNTLFKMAAKRAEVDAVLQLPGVAAVFTQDVGDYRKPEGQRKEADAEQDPGKKKKPTKKKPADSDKVKKIREQARKDREERLAKEEERGAPPEPEEEKPLVPEDEEPEPEEEPVILLHPAKTGGVSVAVEPEEAEPPQGPPRSIEEVTERIASVLPKHSELVKVTEYEDYYRIGRRKTLDKEIENQLDFLVSEMGGAFDNDNNSWRIPKI